uniref:Uncharacterized protein n=1 Tax=Ditylenchus dipsaci TaxID=166011 RepID=A0A915D979_9BILA
MLECFGNGFHDDPFQALQTKLLTDETKKDPTSVIETEVEWKAWLKWATDKSIQTCEYAEKQCKTEDSCFKNKMDCKDLAKTWMTLASDESLHVFGGKKSAARFDQLCFS